MTIRETIGLLKDAKKVIITWNGNQQNIDIFDSVILEAFGNYLIDGIYAVEEDVFEISLAVKPIRKEVQE